MGIHVRCPNGHELHVKSFLAGKRGVCPHCGARIQIPQSADQGSQPQKSGSWSAEIETLGDSTDQQYNAQSPDENARRADVPLGRPSQATGNSVREEFTDQLPDHSGEYIANRRKRGSSAGGHRKQGRHRVALTVLLLAVAILLPIALYVITRP